MKHEIYDSIERTRIGFEDSFKVDSFYNKQTGDQEHLNQILEFLEIHEGMKILDLGTGTGFLAFPIAKKYPKVEVVGLDIVEMALEKNRDKAELEGLWNLQFVSYDGVTFPFQDGEFDLVITRYSLHHFPMIQDTFCEINRVLKPNGRMFLADPAPNPDDTERFVDAYMQMKKDGHIKFYTLEEWNTIGRSAGLKLLDSFETKIRFPKKRETAVEFEYILQKHSKDVIDGYEVEIIDDEIWITERVNNILMQKV